MANKFLMMTSLRLKRLMIHLKILISGKPMITNLFMENIAKDLALVTIILRHHHSPEMPE